MNNYSDVKFEISEDCRIQQYRLLGWRDRDPKQREVEVKKLCTDPIRFCQKYKIVVIKIIIYNNAILEREVFILLKK